MKEDHIPHLLPEYLDDQLEIWEKKKVEDHLKLCSQCQKELQEMEFLLEDFEKESTAEPSANVRFTFYRTLEEEKERISKEISQKPFSRNSKNYSLTYFLKIAAGIALLVCSYLLGKYQQDQKFGSELSTLVEENREIKQTAMLAMLENTSASKRIQGVNYFENISNPDVDIIEALTKRMHYDDNRNVRLTAVEALGNFTTSQEVKKSFITALEAEKDPVIQIAIIQILVKIQEKTAIEPLRNLMANKDTEPFVKEQINALLPTLI